MDDLLLHAGLAEECSGPLELASITIQHSAADQGKTFEISRDVINDAVVVGDKKEATLQGFWNPIITASQHLFGIVVT